MDYEKKYYLSKLILEQDLQFTISEIKLEMSKNYAKLKNIYHSEEIK